MTTISAHPDRLDRFVATTSARHASTALDAAAAAALQGWVWSGSPDFRADVPALPALIKLFDTLTTNDTFVRTIHAELVAADRGTGGGTASTDTARVRAALDAAGLGEPPAPLELEPATLYGLPPTSGFVDDPVCAANGNMIHADHDLTFPGVAAVLDVRRTYNSLLSRRTGAFGAGISSIFDVSLIAGDDRVVVDLPDGAGVSSAAGSRRLHRVERTDDGWTVFTDERTRYRFDNAGYLVGWGAGVAEVSVERDGERIVHLHESVSGRSIDAEWVDGRISRLVSNDGRTTSYTYDGARLSRVTTESGHRDYEWADGMLAAVVDPDGVAPFRNEYDDEGRVVRQTSPFGRVTTYRYDAGGLTVITDQAGTRQAMVHDRRGNLTAVIDADGSAMRLAYDHLDRATRVVERDGATWQYEYDPATGRLAARVDPDSLVARWTWDHHGRVATITDRAGAVTTYEYDSTRCSTPSAVVDPNGGVISIEVDHRLDVPASVTDPDGVRTRYEYDSDGQIAAAVDAHGARTGYSYDPAGHLVGVTDALGTVTTLVYTDGRLTAYARNGADGARLERGTFGYTAAGRLAALATPQETSSVAYGPHGAPGSVADADGNRVSFEYDTMGNISGVTTADGDTFHHFHDEVGRLVGVADPDGATSHLRYDRAARVVELVDAEGRTWRRDVDEVGRTTRAVAPDGAVTGYAYHPNGEVAAVTLPDGRAWRAEVDHAGRATSVTAPDGSVAHTTYSPAGRLVERRSPAGRTDIVEYCAAGRPVAVIDRAGRRRELERDAAGRLVGVTPGGHRFDRDPLGRVIAHRRPGRSERFDYDDAGRLVAHVDGTGAARRYTYDARGLLIAAADPAGGVTTARYDRRGRLVAQTTPGGRTSSFEYGPAGHLTSVTDPTGVVHRLTRDATGMLIGRHSPGTGWCAALDAAGRPTAFSDHTGEVLAEFGYDAAGRATSATAGAWAELFAWSPSDRLDAVTTPDGTTLIDRDAEGWATAVTRPDGTRLDIERDPTGRIVSVAGITADLAATGRPARDPAGRLLLGDDGTAYHYDEAGRLARIERPDGTDTRYAYDADGLVDTERSCGVTRRLTHDRAGRLVAVVSPEGTSHYRYDDAGRRIAEEHPGGRRVEYRWSGAGRLTSVVRTGADGTTANVDITHDAFGRPVHIGGMSVAYDPITGRPARLGDVGVVETPAGTLRSDTGSLHATCAHTPDGLRVGDLTFLGARVHDAATGQFLSPDPLLPRPGTPGAASPYTYAWHDAVNHADPTGLRPISHEEWQTIREREEQGSLGAAWQAIHDDPWGGLAALGVAVVGAGLLFTPLAPIGVGVLAGTGLSTAIGIATGTFDPRHVAIGGVVGGVGAAVAGATMSGTMAANGLIGSGEEAAGRLAHGQLPDVWDLVVAGGVSAGTAGVTTWVDDRTISPTIRSLTGAGAEGSASVAGQVLTGQPLDLREAAVGAAVGGLEPGAAGWSEQRVTRHHVDRALAVAGGDVSAGPAAEMVQVYRVTSIAEALIFDDTGLVVSEAVLDAYAGPSSLVDATRASVARHEAAIAGWYGSETEYAAAAAAFDGALDDVSGAGTLIELTTDATAAEQAAADGAVVATAAVPADALVTQYHDGSVFAPHLLPMEALTPAP